MLDKTILVFYLNVGSENTETRINILNRFRQAIMSTPEDEAKMIKYFIPITEGENRVECLNPTSTCSCNHKMPDKLQEVSDRLDRMDNILFPVTRSVLIEKVSAQ